MSKVVAAVRPANNTLWRLLIVAAMVLSALIPGAMVARADDDKEMDKDHNRQFTIVANVAVMAAGTPIRLASGKFSTTGELIFGCIASSDWNAVSTDGAGCNPFLTQSLFVDHSSVTSVSPTGSISGKASGGFNSISGVTGEYDGEINALYNPLFGVGPTGFPAGLYSIQDTGKWEAEDATGREVKGAFTITMNEIVVTPNGPTLTGQAVLVGKRDK